MNCLQVTDVERCGIFQRILGRFFRLLVVGHLCVTILLIAVVAIIPSALFAVLQICLSVSLLLGSIACIRSANFRLPLPIKTKGCTRWNSPGSDSTRWAYPASQLCS